MAMVRCPTHKIPYNDENPRGCPACAREKEGGRASDVMAMQELARTSQMIRRPSSIQQAPPLPPDDAPVTQRPRFPVPRFTFAMKAFQFARQQRLVAIGGVSIVVLGTVLLATAGPTFTDAPSPAVFAGIVRPLPVTPNDPIAVLLSAVGPQKPTLNPTARELERYSYGTDFVVEALNGQVYAVTFSVPNRSWRGLVIGANQTNAEGILALLGRPRQDDAQTGSRPDTISGYIVYRSLDTRPRKQVEAEVRPPNGCYDVLVDLQPRAIGVLRVGKRNYSVVARVGGPIEWVVTRVRVVSRAMAGPYAGEPVC